jgi:hypothetical protein
MRYHENWMSEWHERSRMVRNSNLFSRSIARGGIIEWPLFSHRFLKRVEAECNRLHANCLIRNGIYVPGLTKLKPRMDHFWSEGRRRAAHAQLRNSNELDRESASLLHHQLLNEGLLKSFFQALHGRSPR